MQDHPAPPPPQPNSQTDSPRSSLSSNPHTPTNTSLASSVGEESVAHTEISAEERRQRARAQAWVFFRYGMVRGSLLVVCGVLGIKLEDVGRRLLAQTSPGLELFSSGLVQAAVSCVAALSNGLPSALAVGFGSLLPVVTFGTLGAIRQRQQSVISVPQHVYLAFATVTLCLVFALSAVGQPKHPSSPNN